jgi:hypothetical protein
MLNTIRSFSLILVVFIHSHVYLIDYSHFVPPASLVFLYNGLLSLFHPASILAAISGYLYFKDHRGDRLLNEKYLKRLRSIFIPYVFWLTVFFVVNNALIYLNAQAHANVFFNKSGGFSLLNYFMSFLYPQLAVAKHLWYLNNLFLAFMISPMLLLINRSLAAVALLFVAVMLFYFTSIAVSFEQSDHVIKYRFIIFYLMGAYLALNRTWFHRALENKSGIAIACIAVYAVITLVPALRGDIALVYIVNSITVPVLVFLAAYALMQRFGTGRETMYNRSRHFLLYIIHPVIISALCKLIFFSGFVLPQNYALFFLAVAVLSWIVIQINNAIYWAMHKVAPTLTRYVL